MRFTQEPLIEPEKLLIAPTWVKHIPTFLNSV
jgi:hypothetical protein